MSLAIKEFTNRLKGQRYVTTKYTVNPKPPTRFVILLSSFVGSFTGIAIVACLTYNANFFVERNTPVMAGSFGASAVLIYGAIESPLSQPRNVIHPPASATALIAVSGGESIYHLGYWYVLCPIALGVALMMIVALIVNNIGRRYPTHWWNPKQNKIAVMDEDMSKSIADFEPPEDDEDGTVPDDATSTATTNAIQTHVSRRSSSTDVPSTTNDLAEPRPQQIRSTSTPHTRHGSQQFAVYYGNELKHSRHQDLEHGQIQRPNAATSDEEHCTHIQQLQDRIRELETQLAVFTK
ncbi:hypothetical protein BGZ49_004533 [Haplosporangium sp. Z 27]|nr:hypothetical protein BGZ49_004533 [Haplosporangium sp. Z 27]